jgi:ammonium transporter, Amt family
MAIGATAERVRLLPALVFVFIWSTIVYDPIACWTWNSRGWAHMLGVLDFAGGTVVHINAGFTALAISLFLGPREFREDYDGPHDTTYVVLGTTLLWFGWFGFNGGGQFLSRTKGRC